MGDGELAAGPLRGLRLAIVVIALVHLAVPSTVSLLAHLDRRTPAVQVTGFAVLLAVLLVAGYLALRDRPPGRWRWPLLVVAGAALAATAVDVPPGEALTLGDWSHGVFTWVLLVLALDLGLPVVAGALTAYTAARLLWLGPAAWPGRSADLVLIVVLLAYQLGIAVVAALLTRMARAVAAAAAADERVRTAESVAAHLHQDRRDRYAGLDTVPLLTALAAGTLDPADERVRVRCAVEGSRLRRLLAERDEVADPLLHEVRACADAAARQGVEVRLAVCGTWPVPPKPVRRALTEPALALVAARWGNVTVIGAPGEVRVSVVTGGGPHQPVPPGAAGVTVTSLAEGDRRWVESTWRTGT